jgi:hypothetical protein
LPDLRGMLLPRRTCLSVRQAAMAMPHESIFRKITVDGLLQATSPRANDSLPL